MADRDRLIAVMHEALTPTGRYGGWVRDRTYARTFMVVWSQGDEQGVRLTVVLDLAPHGTRWSYLRILQRIDGGLVNLVEAKVSCLDHALGVLATYDIIDQQWLIPYRRGYREGYRIALNVKAMRAVLDVP